MGGVANFSGLNAAAFPSWFVGAIATLGLEDAVFSLLSVAASFLLLAGASSLLLAVAAAMSCLGDAASISAAFVPCSHSTCAEKPLLGYWGWCSCGV